MNSSNLVLAAAFLSLAPMAPKLSGERVPVDSEYDHIVGGQDVGVGELPFAGSVTAWGYSSCTGSLIHEDVVLTAAHCVDSSMDTGVSVTFYDRVGESSGNRYEGKVSADSVDICIHPSWRGRDSRGEIVNNTYDAAIVILDQDIPILPIGPPRDGTPMEIGLSAGYGETRNPFSNPVLQKTPVEIRGSSYSTVLRAGSPDGHIAPGDSGGPLMVWSLDGWAQVGIASGINSDSTDGAYTSMSSVQDWVYDNQCWDGSELEQDDPEAEESFSGTDSWSRETFFSRCSVEIEYTIVPGEEDGSTFEFTVSHTSRSRKYFRPWVRYLDSLGREIDSDYFRRINVYPSESPKTESREGTAPPNTKSVDFERSYCQ